MFKLYRKSQEVQIAWIKKHPFQYVALNAIALGAFFAYQNYQDRKAALEIAEEISQMVE